MAPSASMRIPNNPFINFMVRCPCIMALASLAITLLATVVSIRIIVAEGDKIISDSANQDFNDIRSRQRQAYEAAVSDAEIMGKGVETADCEADGPPGTTKKCDNTTYPPLTLGGQIVLTVFSANDNINVFTKNSLVAMKFVEDKLVKHQNFSNFCRRRDPTGEDISCQPPLSPLNLFYAKVQNTDIKTIVETLDALDGTTDGKLDVMLKPNLGSHLGQIQKNRDTINQGLATMQPPPFTSPCMVDLLGKVMAVANDTSAVMAMWADPTTQVCIIDTAAANVAGIDPDAITVYKTMIPFTTAMRGERGDSQQDVASTLKLAAYCKKVGFYAAYVDYYFDVNFGIDNMKSRYSRGGIEYGSPLPGFRNGDDRKEDQRKLFTDWFNSEFLTFLKETSDVGEVEVLFFATPLIRTEFLSIIAGDGLRVLMSLVLVFIWIWVQTNSVVIAAAGALEIVLSIPLAFFFYYGVFQFRYFDGLNFMTLFIVVAIGADDIFVFMDQYKQSAYYKEVCADLKSRMNWVYGRASWAMFITSATTCAAFVCTAVNPLPNIQSFGIFSAFVIVADYLLVITWFPACVVLYHNYLEKRPCCFCCCRCKEMWPCTRAMETTTASVASRGAEEAPPKRLLERLMSDHFAGFVKRFAIFIVIFFVVLLIPAGYLAGGIQPLSRSEEMLPPDHPFQRLWTISGEEFPSSAQTPNTAVHVVWGVEDMDNSKVSILFNGPKDEGVLVYDKTFKFDAAAQQHIYNVCEEVRKMEAPGLADFLSRDEESPDNAGKVGCPVVDWKNFLLANGKTWPLPLAEVRDTFPMFLESSSKDKFGRNVSMKERWSTSVSWDPIAREVKMVVMEVSSQLMQRASHPSARLKTHYQRFEDWVAILNAADGRLPAPATANKAFQTSDGDFNGPNWIWMNTQDVFRRSAVMGAVIGTALAFVVILFATQQIIIAFASFVTIASILATVLAMMKMAGYELGSTASICITILAGFAVDYVVHLAHAFNHSKSLTRTEKFQDAFDDIGVSVLSGMVTSVLAAAVLLTCVLQFFALFGFFLICTVTWAWVWGNLFFMGLMKLGGPDENTHFLLQLPHSVLPAWPFGKGKAKEES